MDLAVVNFIDVLYAIANLALISIGLAIIFGMMRVINLAHGEFLMLGGYTAIIATQNGINIWISMLIVAPIVVGAIGIVVERLVIRFLYGRMIDTMLATWGLSLFFIGLVTTIFGAKTEGISAPLGYFEIGQYKYADYKIFIIVFAVALLIAIYLLLRYTRAGLIARGTMQGADVAAGLGINTSTVYAVTFAAGAALTGLAGALIAPLNAIIPSVGIQFIAKSFITVIGGGGAFLTGTVSASTLFGGISQLVSIESSPVFGEVALLIGAVVLLRMLPRGITGRFFRRSL